MKLPISKFFGMDSVNMGGISENGVVPFLLVDAIPDNNGTLIKRPSLQKYMDLPGKVDCVWRSPASGNVYCVCDNQLLLLDILGQTYTTLDHNLPATDGRKTYFYCDMRRDYMGNVFWAKMFSGGKEIDPASLLDSAQYSYTESSVFSYKDRDSATLNPFDWLEPFFPMDNLCFGHGRLWGSVDNRVFYSEPGRFHLWSRMKNVITMPCEVTMVAPVNSGVWIGTAHNLVWVSGRSPETFQMSVKGDVGVVRDSLVYPDVIGDLEAAPMWLNNNGYVQAGGEDGGLFEVTHEKVQLGPCKMARASKFYYNGLEIVSWSKVNLRKE